MTTSQSKHAVEDADARCAEHERCEPEPRALRDAIPLRPRVLVVTAEAPVGYPLRQPFEAEYEVSWASGPHVSLYDLLRDADADIAVVDWSTLGRIVPETTHEDGKVDTWVDPLVSVDLKAVMRLGTILKSLSAGSRARRRIS